MTRLWWWVQGVFSCAVFVFGISSIMSYLYGHPTTTIMNHLEIRDCDKEIKRLIAWWIEFQNMVAANRTWLPPEMLQAQAKSWARANVSTGDPRYD